jgi:hypothetical protein
MAEKKVTPNNIIKEASRNIRIKGTILEKAKEIKEKEKLRNTAIKKK